MSRYHDVVKYSKVLDVFCLVIARVFEDCGFHITSLCRRPRT